MCSHTEDAVPVEAARSERVGDRERSPRVSMKSACGKTLGRCPVSRRVGCTWLEVSEEGGRKRERGKQIKEGAKGE